MASAAAARRGAATWTERLIGYSCSAITIYAYDALGRMKRQTQPDSSTIISVYSGNMVTLTDEAGNQWKRTADGAGRSTQVLEPGTASKAPSIETDYAYGGLTSYVNQKGTGGETARTRSFMTDGAGNS